MSLCTGRYWCGLAETRPALKWISSPPLAEPRIAKDPQYSLQVLTKRKTRAIFLIIPRCRWSHRRQPSAAPLPCSSVAPRRTWSASRSRPLAARRHLAAGRRRVRVDLSATSSSSVQLIASPRHNSELVIMDRTMYGKLEPGDLQQPYRIAVKNGTPSPGCESLHSAQEAGRKIIRYLPGLWR